MNSHALVNGKRHSSNMFLIKFLNFKFSLKKPRTKASLLDYLMLKTFIDRLF